MLVRAIREERSVCAIRRALGIHGHAEEQLGRVGARDRAPLRNGLESRKDGIHLSLTVVDGGELAL
jgi:hypothetical protein